MNKGGEIGQQGLEILQRQLHAFGLKKASRVEGVGVERGERERKRQAVRAPKLIRMTDLRAVKSNLIACRTHHALQPHWGRGEKMTRRCYEEKEKGN